MIGNKSINESINSYTIYNCYSDITYSVLATTAHQVFYTYLRSKKDGESMEF